MRRRLGFMRSPRPLLAGYRVRVKPPRTPRVPEFGRPEATEFEIAGTTHRVADVPPMDVDGVRTMTVGTILWAVAILALIPFWGTLRNDGNEWWLWTAIAGFGLGLVGIEYCRLRRDALAAAPAEERRKSTVRRQTSRRDRKAKVVEAAPPPTKEAAHETAVVGEPEPESRSRRARVRVEQKPPVDEHRTVTPQVAAKTEPAVERPEPSARPEPSDVNEPAISDDLPPVGRRRRAKPVDPPAAGQTSDARQGSPEMDAARQGQRAAAAEHQQIDPPTRRPGRRARQENVEDTGRFPVAEEPYAPHVGRRRRK